jgi:signal transduction histidine kinase
MLSASRKATYLTQSLLSFSRQKPVMLAPLDMNNTVKNTEKLLNRLIAEDIELLTFLTKQDTTIMADMSQIDQILFNLVTNARDAMPRGGKITIKTDVADIGTEFINYYGFGEPGKYVILSVSDTGSGLDKVTIKKMFDPFFTTKETGKGTGLGLATVYGIVKQHNGYITVESEPGRGATFFTYFPLTEMVVREKKDTFFPCREGAVR